MAQSEDQPLPQSQRQRVAQMPGWLSHAVVLVSAALCASALFFALQVHASVALQSAALVAGCAYAAMLMLHLLMQSRSSRVAPALRSQAQSRSRPKAAAADASLAADIAPELNTPSPIATIQVAATPHVFPMYTAPQRRTLAPSDAPAIGKSVEGFEHLQSLVAELARTTPGPKATTPDPDAVQAATAVAWAQYVASKAADATTTRQVEALNDAAIVMAQNAPHARTPSSAGFAAELSAALAADRLTVYLEPIQQIESDRPRHYEVSVRFKDATGIELPHQQILAAAREAGLLPRVDAAVLPRAARIAHHFKARGRDTDILARIHGASLPDTDFRAEVTAATIAADGAALVLSFAQSDVRSFGPIHWEILSKISEMGLRFAIESVTDLDMDFESLRYRGFGFVKLDADVLIEGLPASGALISSADVCRHFGASGLALIVDHIDDEHSLARILGFGVLFGQGALFGTKRAVRADILTSAAA